MSQYNNANHINSIPVIPDYLDIKDDNDDGLFITLNREGENNEEEEVKPEEEDEPGTINNPIDLTQEENEVEVEDEVEQEEMLNTNDTDEAENETKIYVISVNNIPYYYETTLTEARTQMINLANHFVGGLNDVHGPGHIYVTDNNLKRVKVIAPYNFLMLTYNYVIHEISLEYAIKL